MSKLPVKATTAPTLRDRALAIKPTLELVPALIASELDLITNQADRAVVMADELVVDTTEAAGRAVDAVSVIKRIAADLDERRLAKTRPLDALKKTLMALYGVPTVTLQSAETTLNGKVRRWRIDEQIRLDAAALVQRKARDAQAQAFAAQQTAVGDLAGARQILEEAAALPPPVAKVVVTGAYGASLSVRKRPVGEVTDIRAFLAVLLAAKDPRLMSLVDQVKFSATQLNTLAKAVHEGELMIPQGFKVSEVSTDVVL